MLFPDCRFFGRRAGVPFPLSSRFVQGNCLRQFGINAKSPLHKLASEPFGNPYEIVTILNGVRTWAFQRPGGQKFAGRIQILPCKGLVRKASADLPELVASKPPVQFGYSQKGEFGRKSFACELFGVRRVLNLSTKINGYLICDLPRVENFNPISQVPY
jgi:hypothetical protein